MSNGEASGLVVMDSKIAPAQISRSRPAGFAWAALSGTIFPSRFAVTRFSVTRQLQIWDITALRFGIGAVLLAPTILRRGSRLPLVAWRQGFLFALLWGLLFVQLVALGLKLTSAAQAASIAPALMPGFAGVFACTFLRQRQGRIRWLGYEAIVAGLGCLSAAGTPVHGAPNSMGIGVLTAAAATWPVYMLLFRRSGLSPIQAAALMCVWSAVMFLPLYLFLGLSRFEFASSGEIILQVISQGGLKSGVAIVTYNRAVSLPGPGAAIAIIALLPAMASILPMLILGELHSPAECASVAGVVFASKPVPTHTLSTVAQPRWRSP
jgi:drug/metabolite transporter (DMT)-like permease